jgi:hypothetical protein
MKGNDMKTQLSAVEAFRLMALTEFKPFTESDWEAYLGCESENPFIGYNGDYTLVLDGETLNVCHFDDGYGGQLFSLAEI